MADSATRLRAPSAAQAGAPGGRSALVGGLLLALVVVALLAGFASADPPAGLTGSNAPWTDEGFNLANARNRVLFGRFDTDDVDRSLTNGAYSGLAALVFAVTGPSIVAGRWISIAASAAAVLLLALGLARPLGTRAALLAAAALGSCQLVLAYGRLAFTESLVVALLAAALALAARAPLRPGLPAGAGLGLVLATAVSVKAIALVPAAAILGVLLTSALARRDRRALAMGGAALAAGLAAALGWLLLVGLPNLDRLRIALRIWPRVHYPHNPGALVSRLAAYVRDSDGALPRTAPLLVAAATGAVLLAWRWRELPAARRDLLVTGLVWALASWGAIVVGDYAPNRYIVPALPGLAVLAGAGLAALAERFGSGRLAAVVLAVALAAPGVAGFLGETPAGGRQLADGQRALAAAAGDGDRAVVYGAYGPTMLFGTHAVLVTPWAPAGANVGDVVARLRLTHLITDETQPATGPPLATVRWGPHTLRLAEVKPDQAP